MAPVPIWRAPTNLRRVAERKPEAPKAVSFLPLPGSTLGSDGLDYDVNVTFDRAIRLPVGWEKARGTALLTCELDDDLFIPLNAPRGTRIHLEVPDAFQAVPDNQTLQFQIGRLPFYSRYGCAIKIGEGIVVGIESGAANIGAEYEVVISDNVPPITKLSGWNIPLHPNVLVVSFLEPVYFTGLAPSLHRLVMNNGTHYEKVTDLEFVRVTGENKLDLELVLPFELLQDNALYSVALEKGTVQDRKGNPMAAFEVGTYTFRALIEDRPMAQAKTTWNAAGVAGIVVGACVVLGILVFSSWMIHRCMATLHDKGVTAATDSTCEVSNPQHDMEKVGPPNSSPRVHHSCEEAISEMAITEADDRKVDDLLCTASDNLWLQDNVRSDRSIDLPCCISSREPSPSISLHGSSRNSSKQGRDRQQMAGASAQRPVTASEGLVRNLSPDACMNAVALSAEPIESLSSTCNMRRNSGSRQPSRHRSLPPSGRSREIDANIIQRSSTTGGGPTGIPLPRIQDLGKSRRLQASPRWRDPSQGRRRRDASQASSRDSSSVGSARSLHVR